MEKLRVFISYDYKYDEALKDKLIADSEKVNSSFDVVDTTIHTDLDTDYKLEVGKRIKESDLVIFICGENTKNCLSQGAEMSITREEGKDYFLIKNNDNVNEGPMNSRPYDIIYDYSKLESLLNGER